MIKDKSFVSLATHTHTHTHTHLFIHLKFLGLISKARGAVWDR